MAIHNFVDNTRDLNDIVWLLRYEGMSRKILSAIDNVSVFRDGQLCAGFCHLFHRSPPST